MRPGSVAVGSGPSVEVLKKPHPIYGNVAGKASYAIRRRPGEFLGWREIGGDAAVFAERCAPRRVSFLAPRLATIVESCAAAAESTDARDKYFLSCPRFRYSLTQRRLPRPCGSQQEAAGDLARASEVGNVARSH